MDDGMYEFLKRYVLHFVRNPVYYSVLGTYSTSSDTISDCCWMFFLKNDEHKKFRLDTIGKLYKYCINIKATWLPQVGVLMHLLV